MILEAREASYIDRSNPMHFSNKWEGGDESESILAGLSMLLFGHDDYLVYLDALGSEGPSIWDRLPPERREALGLPPAESSHAE